MQCALRILNAVKMKRLANQGGQANYRINIPHAFAKNSNAPKASVSINRERRMNNEYA